MSPFTYKEIQDAELIIIRRAQGLEFFEEIYALKRNETLPRNSKLKRLSVYWDNDNEVIRLETRLSKSESLPNDFTNPILIPKGKIAKMKILQTHTSRIHCSQKQTFDIIRRKFWIVGGYGFIKSIVRKCKTPRSNLHVQRWNNYQQ
jgi:hypothetical protein